MGNNEYGVLYICPTPIGNLEDVTLRSLRILKEVEIIAAEDTRRTLKLLEKKLPTNYLEILQKIWYHTKGTELLKLLEEGKDIALVSDAGMPCISDPGQEMIKLCIENNIKFEVLPGANAVLTALVHSGLSTDKFAFEGFLDRNKKKRRERLEKILYDDRTLVFYEAPHRITDTLKDMVKVLGNRKIVVARELTKKFEEIIRGDIESILNRFNDNRPKGELVIVVEGSTEEKVDDVIVNLSFEEHIIKCMDEGLTKKDAIKKVAKDRGIPKREVYEIGIDL